MSETAPEAITPVAISAQERADALRRVNRRRGRFLHAMFDWAKSALFALVLFVLVRAFVVEAFKIPSGSMEGTLLVGDFLLVNKLLFGAELPVTRTRLPAIRAPRRGDIIVFQYPQDPSKNFVKRLVGLPGDTLAMTGGTLLRNGRSVREDYVRHTDPDYDPSADDFRWQRNHLVKAAEASVTNPSRNNWGPLVVPARHFFVLGDNRDNSLDSRYWGFVPDSMVRGTPMIVYYSFIPDSASRMAWLTRIRWHRLGTRIH